MNTRPYSADLEVELRELLETYTSDLVSVGKHEMTDEERATVNLAIDRTVNSILEAAGIEIPKEV
jgi:hypothetical protein